jgi:glutathione peroxidase|tara:strand:+ start:272 stop:796 length:525 start_codon:yes stop_codon:yes gene_type:complete
MKKILYLLFFIPTISFGACMDFYDQNLKTLQGKSFNLCEHQDKPIIFVNTASKCGFTSQFEGLEALYKKHNNKLTIVGFPSNDFNQEFSSDKEIQDFCKLTYAVEFPMMSKSSVIGKNANPVYQYLYEKTGKAPMWNFYKYLVMPGASDIHVFSSTTQPNSDKILGLLKPYISD